VKDSDPQENWEVTSTQSDSAVKINEDIVMDDPDAVYDEEEATKAEEYKDKGNEYFKRKISLCHSSLCLENQFEKSIDMYTEAIFCKIHPAKKSVYFCNRALANLKLENFAVALFDACESVKHDKTNVKGYYRRAQSYFAMRQLKNAMNDFKTVCKMQPQNRDARQKFEDTKKEFNLQQFAAAIVSDEKKIVIDVNDMVVEASYSGPKFDSVDEITPEWIQNCMEFFRDQKKLHKKFATMIIQKATEIFEKEETLTRVPLDDLEEITVCGDVHGQYYDLLNIFKLNGNPSETNPYVFNGDFIDRGSFSVEVILTLLMWKICLPQHLYMTRGNHEASALNRMYGFYGEVTHKYTKD
jgi:serine/threonine-protein phosphatase 5